MPRGTIGAFSSVRQMLGGSSGRLALGWILNQVQDDNSLGGQGAIGTFSSVRQMLDGSSGRLALEWTLNQVQVDNSSGGQGAIGTFTSGGTGREATFT